MHVGYTNPKSCIWGLYGIDFKWLREKQLNWYLRCLFSKHQIHRQWHLNTFGWNANINRKCLKQSGKDKGHYLTKGLEWLLNTHQKQWLKENNEKHWKHWKKIKITLTKKNNNSHTSIYIQEKIFLGIPSNKGIFWQ